MRKLLLPTLALAIAASAQTTPPPAVPPAPAATPANEKAPAAPTLTEIESLKFENIQLKATILQKQFEQSPGELEVQKEFSDFMAQLGKEHPGYLFNPQTKTFAKAAAPAKADQPKEKAK